MKFCTLLRIKLLVTAIFLQGVAVGQSVIDPSTSDLQYDSKKKAAVTRKFLQHNNQATRSQTSSRRLAREDSRCFIPLDSSYIAVPRNDDGSLRITIPFSFNLYGTSYNTVYINTNGNLTFNSSYFEYRPTGFPINVPMVAAFWADVDTRNPLGGQVYYKISATRLIVTWDRVGYYEEEVDKLNTFQIIIGVTGDSLIGPNNNVKLNYKSLEWASSDGFGASRAATAGINSGDGSKYIQIGRFNQDNSNYDGPGGNFDGIHYLDNTCFPFNVTSADNIPPSVSGLPSTNPVTVNVGDTVKLKPQFIGPEFGQIVTTTVDTRNACRITHIDSNGQVSKVDLTFIADTCNVGTNVITFTATDNGTPVQSTVINYTIIVNKLNQTISFPPLPDIRYGTPPFSLTGTASSNLPITYTITGPASISGNVVSITGVGTVTITASQPGNNVFNPATSVTRSFCVIPSMPGKIEGDTIVCINTQKTYSVPNIAGATFTWTVSGGGTLTPNGNNASIQWTTPGTFTISVKYNGNCGTSDSTRILTVVVDNQLTGAISNMKPDNGNIDLMLPVTFSWSAIGNAVSYDLYLGWDEPNRPSNQLLISDILQTNYTISDSSVILYGIDYRWHVVAKRNCYSLSSPVQTFKLQYSPDLVVDSIGIPAIGFAGRTIKVSWKVKNVGRRLTTNNTWTDRVFITASPVFSAGSALSQHDFVHNGNLQPDSSYTQVQELLLPANISGQYYIHVFTDATKQLLEYNEGGEDNNIRVSDAFNVSLKMPADLVVSEIIVPAKASAGQKANIKWTTKNQGDSVINEPLWYDKIYISTSTSLNINNAILVASYSHSGGLDANGEYSNSVLVTVPVVPAGNYYVHVIADAEKNAFEYDENNNVKESNLFFVGVPDLMVSNVSIPGSVNAGQKLKVTWNIKNTGTGATETASWTDRIFLSPDNTYSPDNAIWFDVKFAAQTLETGASINREIELRMPDIVSGRYYAYVYTDFGKAVYEDTSEYNNISRSTSFSDITTGGPVNDIGISEIITPVSDCGLTGSETVKVKISNYGNLFHSGFDVSYRLNNGAVVTENVGSASLLPGSTLLYQFNTKVNLSSMATYTIKVHTSITNDTFPANDSLTKVIQHFPPLASPANLLPADGSLDVSKPVTFSWSAVPNSTRYDLFVWKASDTMPSTPVASNLTQINYSFSGGLLYGTSYKWRVITKSTNCQTPSAIQTFTTRHLPDLVIDSIVVPANGGTSEAPFSLSWKTKNIGLGTTGSTGWYETIYLSQSATDRSNDVFIAYLPNVSALNGGQSFPQPLYTFTIPQGYQGRYYIVVKTNVARNLEELTDTNNIKIAAIDITLAPPPDLYVDSLVVAPTTLFSEDTLNVSWIVKNTGTGPTTTSSWTDHVYLSKNHILNIAGAVRLGSFERNGALNVNESYRRSARFKLPAHIGGSYFIHVVTDVSNRVYEYVNENNNTATWDSLNVIMRPNPNLVITSVSIPLDTLSNNQTISLSWTTKNEGAAPANPTWHDNMRLTMDTANGYRNYYDLGSFIQSNVLQSSSATGSQQNIKLPNNLSEGKYFAYGVADIYNSVFEGAVEETDNVSPYSASVYVVNPDLKPTGILAPTNARSEESITMSWEILNAGKGAVYNSSWNDAIYLSKDSVLDNTDVLLKSVSNNALLPSGSQYSKQQAVTLPRGISGAYNLIVVADAGSGVFEKSESNNQFLVPINITIAPWPDLQITSIQLPATDTAGTNITFTYAGKNFGSAKIDKKAWKDAFYLSPTKNLNDPNKIFLVSHSNLRTLDTAQSYTNTVTAVLPSSISGPYYLIGIADDGDDVYEYTSENNNQRVSDTSVSISQLPNVDLAVITGKVVADSLTPGQTVSVEWFGGNAGTTPTIIGEWEDAVYLSNNPTLDASDRLLKTVKVNKLLQPATSYNQKTSVVIPNDASGKLYFLVNVDRANQQNDINRSNNTRVLDIVVKDSGQVVDSGGGVVIVPPLPSDLTPISFTAAATGISGQPFDLSYSVINNGKGITNNSTWIDRAYLSNDLLLDASDRVIGSFPHNGKLASMMQYADTQQVFIPADVAGNYVVIFKTDDNDNVFELNAENNNTAFGNILIKPQQPCDLVVSGVTPPLGTQVAGRNITVNYSVQNVGSNPAQGYFSNAVYLSKDTVWDVNDLLLGTTGDYYSLPPQATVSKQLVKRLINVAAGNYYVIVRADILNNMAEVNENNNIRSAVSPIAVDVKLLNMNVLASDTLANDENLYYRINIPAGQKGETMALTLKGDSTNHAINRLYLKFGEAPAANSYDFVSEIPFEENQEIIVPELKEGTYYIMASGSNTATAYQSVTLLARIIPFEITKVDARKGGNTGAVTVKINGAKFDSTTSFKLSGIKGAISPEKLYYINSTQVFATFNLLNADTGFYSVVATKLNNDSARLVNGFEIEKGVGSTAGNNGTGPGTGTGFVCRVINIGFESELETSVYHPASTRPLRFVAITIYYENKGNVDIPVPARFLVSLKEKVPLSFSPDELPPSTDTAAHIKGDLPLEFSEQGGPPGIMRPGASGFIKIYTIAYDRNIGSLDFIIIE